MQGFFDALDSADARPEPVEHKEEAPKEAAASEQCYPVEVPMRRLDQVEKGDVLRLLSDPAALWAACRVVACINQKDCALTAGETVRVLEKDPSDDTVKVRLRSKGEIWFTIGSFASDEVPTDGDAPGDSGEQPQEPPQEESAPEPPAAPARRGLFEQFAEQGRLMGFAEGSEAEEAIARAVAEREERERQEEAELAAAAAAREAEAEERRRAQRSKGLPGAGEAIAAAASEPRSEEAAPEAPKAEGPCTEYPLGKAVKVLQAIVMRSQEDIASSETAKLVKGQELRVLAHGTSPGGRRLFAKEMETNEKGWVSCATKTGKALLELLPGMAIPVDELDPPTSTALVRMPTVQEVLARIAADAYLEDDGVRAPKALLDGAEEEAEAICVWHSFADMAAVDEPEQEDPREHDPRCLHARERERSMFEGDLTPITQLSEEQQRQAQDHQLRLLAKDREAKVARSQGMKEKLKEAVMPRTKGLMPKTRGIASRSTAGTGSEAASSSSSTGVAGALTAPPPLGAPSRVSHFSAAMGSQVTRFAPRPSSWPEAPSSNFSPQQQVALQSIQELRWTLEEERRQAAEEPADGSKSDPQQPQAIAWKPRRATRPVRARTAASSSAAASSVGFLPAVVEEEEEARHRPPAPSPAPMTAPDPAPAAAPAEPGAGLRDGMAVQVCGLKSAPEMNGLRAVCQHWDPEGSRWVVRLESGKCKKFRPQNLAPCEEPRLEEPPPASGGGMDNFGPAWFGQPDPEAAVDVGPVVAPVRPPPSPPREEAPAPRGFGAAPFGRPEEPDDADVPSLDALLEQLDDGRAAAPAGAEDKAATAKKGCEDFGKPEYWARLGLGSR